MNPPIRVLCAFVAALLCGVAVADTAGHPAPPEQGASPPATQDPAQASRKADETMSEKAPRPVPGIDPKPGPPPKSPPAKSPQADETMSKDAPRRY